MRAQEVIRVELVEFIWQEQFKIWLCEGGLCTRMVAPVRYAGRCPHSKATPLSLSRCIPNTAPSSPLFPTPQTCPEFLRSFSRKTATWTEAGHHQQIPQLCASLAGHGCREGLGQLLKEWDAQHRNGGTGQQVGKTALDIKPHNSVSPCVSLAPPRLPGIFEKFFKKSCKAGPD